MTEHELQGTLREALATGIRPERIITMVQSIRTLNLPEPPQAPPPDMEAGMPIYVPGTIPDGLIDLPSAAKKYGCSVDRLRNWVNRGYILRQGKLKAPGGGYLVVREAELAERIRQPVKYGPRTKKV